MSALDVSDIVEARRHLLGIVRKTPFERSAVLSDLTGMAVYLKAECLQRTGSFKLRGAYHKIASLSSEGKKRGIVTSSAGNHGQGVGFAANRFNIPTRIYVPEIVPRNKLEAIQRYNVEVLQLGEGRERSEGSIRFNSKDKER